MTSEAGTSDAIARLTADQQRLVGACLEAATHGRYLCDGDFHPVMGVERDEAAAVTAAWPSVAENGLTFRTVNNALNNLLGYPHGRWTELRQEIGGDEKAVAAALRAWRNDDGRPGNG